MMFACGLKISIMVFMEIIIEDAHSPRFGNISKNNSLKPRIVVHLQRNTHFRCAQNLKAKLNFRLDKTRIPMNYDLNVGQFAKRPITNATNRKESDRRKKNGFSSVHTFS